MKKMNRIQIGNVSVVFDDDKAYYSEDDYSRCIFEKLIKEQQAKDAYIVFIIDNHGGVLLRYNKAIEDQPKIIAGEKDPKRVQLIFEVAKKLEVGISYKKGLASILLLYEIGDYIPSALYHPVAKCMAEAAVKKDETS